LKEKDTLNVVNDQIGSPTYAADLAQVIFAIINHANWQPGVFNYSNDGEISWYEFTLAIQEISGLECKVSGISSSQYLTSAKRPAFSLLNKEKIKRTYNIVIPYFESSLRKCLRKLN
jgi:dTDP-4-dehydrorhamnose reductase